MPRDKNTDSQTIDAEDLPDLTPQQQNFVKCLLDGMTATDAYRQSYNTTMTGNALWTSAAKLKVDPKVKLWIAAARNASLHSGKCTLEGHLKRLEELSQEAREAGNYGAAVQAEQLRGKAQGLYVDQIKDLTERPTNELIDQIEQTLGKELAQQVAQQLGIEYKHTEH